MKSEDEDSLSMVSIYSDKLFDGKIIWEGFLKVFTGWI